MADQYEVVTRLLQTNGLADWHVVEPVSGDVRDYVWISAPTPTGICTFRSLGEMLMICPMRNC
jgi:hypothetical protein